MVPDGAIDCAANKRLNQPIPQATAAALTIAALTMGISTAAGATADHNGLSIGITAGAGTWVAAITAGAIRVFHRAWTAERIRRGPGLDSRPAQTGLDQADWAWWLQRTLQIATEEPADRGKVGGCLLG
eukprot:COSAG06_NODE_12423_length_1384_cov_1.491051_1_plen_129_part_00